VRYQCTGEEKEEGSSSMGTERRRVTDHRTEEEAMVKKERKEIEKRLTKNWQDEE